MLVVMLQPPQGPELWTGVFNARHEGPICIQQIQAFTLGQEDCLYLNVYTPEPVSYP